MTGRLRVAARLTERSGMYLLRSDVSHGHAQFDMQVPPYFSRNTLHYGPDTYIELRRADRGSVAPVLQSDTRGVL